MADKAKTVLIEDAQLIFRNFEGREGPYNQAGQRNFAVVLPKDVADMMLADGWNVKVLEARDEDEEDTYYLQVSVKFDVRPPRVVMITSTARTNLTEETVEALDWADIQTADLIVRAYEWTVNGKTGIKAYLQSLFVTIEEDALERKYAYYEHEESEHE